MFTKKTLSLVGALTALSAGAWAQTPPPSHHGLLGRLFHHPAAMPGMMHGRSLTPPPGGGMPMAGGVIGNVHTDVYHLPGDGSLSAPKNRRYFASAAAAQAAGYHASGHGPMGHSSGHMTGRPKRSH